MFFQVFIITISIVLMKRIVPQKKVNNWLQCKAIILPEKSRQEKKCLVAILAFPSVLFC